MSVCELCKGEFAVAHRICDKCGWPNGLRPDCPEGLKLQVQRALKNAESREPNWHSFFDIISKAYDQLGCDGPRVARLLLNLLRNPPDEGYYGAAGIISKLGDPAIRAVPDLAEIAMVATDRSLSKSCLDAIQSIASQVSDARQRKDFESVGRRLLDFLKTKYSDPVAYGGDVIFASTCGAIAALGLVESACEIALRECHKDHHGHCALGFGALEAIGPPAIPVLKRFTYGLFRDRRLDQRARSAISQIEYWEGKTRLF